MVFVLVMQFQTQQIYCARDKAGNITQGAEVKCVAKLDVHTSLLNEDLEALLDSPSVPLYSSCLVYIFTS